MNFSEKIPPLSKKFSGYKISITLALNSEAISYSVENSGTRTLYKKKNTSEFIQQLEAVGIYIYSRFLMKAG